MPTAPVPTATAAAGEPEGKIPLRWWPRLKLADVAGIPAALSEKLAPNKEPLALESTEGTPASMPTKISVDDCKQYLSAIDDEYAAASGFDIAQESFFKGRCRALWFLQNARPSRKSFVGKIRLDHDPLSVLPASMNIEMEGPSDEQKAAIAKGQRLGAYTPELKVTRKEATGVVFVDTVSQIECKVDIVAWGDLDHDGLEDMLLYQTMRSLEGSFQGYRHVVLTRKGPTEPLVETRRFE